MHEQPPIMPNNGDISNNMQQPQVINKRSIEEAVAYDYDFDVMNVISQAWARVNGVKLPFFLVLLVISVINFVANFVVGFIIATLPEMLALIISFAVSIALSVLSASAMILGLKHLRGEKIEIGQCFLPLSGIFITLIIGNFLVAILTTIGFILLIIPGIYLAIAYTLVQWIIVDNPGVNAWQALEASRKIVTKHWFKVFLLGFLLGIIVIVSAIPLGIGLIWTIPLAALSIGTLYRIIFEK